MKARVGSKNIRLYVLFIRSYLALLLDSPVDNTKPYHVFQRFFKELKNTDPRELVKRYSSLAERIMATAVISSDYTITGEFLVEMLHTPIAREYLHFFKTGDSRCLQFILSFLWFGKKMNYVDADLESVAFRDWIQIERDLDDFQLPVDIIDYLRIIVAQIVPDIDDSILLPRHGPGYTSEGSIDPNDKLDILSFDRKSRYVFRPNSFGRVGVDRISIQPWLAESCKEQVAKLRFVPKNVKTMRSICMEPSSRMFLQQEVSRWLVDTFSRTFLSSIVDLSDQESNRAYALHGSYSMSCDTIDLSAASDRLSIKLIKSVFPKKVLFYLLGTRTDRVDANGDIISLNKFAPMGSALCFPVQCIIFSAITLLAYLRLDYGRTHEGDLPRDWYYLHHLDEFVKMMHSRPEHISLTSMLRPRVYGDDIICDHRITDDVLILLAQCGLKVNTEKCFTGGQLFRESCGIFAYNGEDVTPLLFRVKSHQRQLDASVVASIFDQINRAGDFGFYHLRSELINYVRRSEIKGIRGDASPFIPFSSDRSAFGIYTTNPRIPSRVREHVYYQRTEKQVMIIRSSITSRRVSRYIEQYAYDQWMRARIRGGSDEYNYSSSRIRPQVTRIRLGWTPV